jgi:Flp pilus assembly pilin Flp
MKTQLHHIKSSARGSALMEYGITTGIISILALVALVPLGSAARSTFDNIADAAQNVITTDESVEESPSTRLMNGGAEQGTEYWTGDFESANHAGPTHFWLEQQNYGESFQVFRIPEDRWEDVDTGNLQSELTWTQSSYNNDDQIGMEITFLDSKNQELLSVNSGLTSVPAGTWTDQYLTSLVASQSRAVRITMTGQQISGINNDGYVDDIDFSFGSLLAQSIIAYQSECIDLNGWTLAGSMSIRNDSPYESGASFCSGGQSAPTSSGWRTVPVTSEYQDAALAGEAQLSLTWQQGSWSGNDVGAMYIDFLDAGGSTISSLESTKLAGPSADWNTRNLTGAIPSAATSIRLTMDAERFEGANNDAYFDDIVLEYSKLP